MASRGVNKVFLLGNVGKAPEIRYTPNGDAVANFSVATSETWKDKSTGQKQEATEWHRCVAFNRLAEIVEQYVNKGSKLYLEGKLKTRQWEQEGIKRYSTEIVVSDMQMLGDKNQAAAQPSPYANPEGQSRQPEQSQDQSYSQAKTGSGTARAPHSQSPSSFDNFDDDIPF